MVDTETRRGSCHCGAVRYTVELDRNPAALSCNCSMCGRAGTLLSFVPASRFRFNKHSIHHLFCRTCGIKSFARGKGRDGQETVAVNVRCLEGFEPDQFRITPFDGRSR